MVDHFFFFRSRWRSSVKDGEIEMITRIIILYHGSHIHLLPFKVQGWFAPLGRSVRAFEYSSLLLKSSDPFHFSFVSFGSFQACHVRKVITTIRRSFTTTYLLRQLSWHIILQAPGHETLRPTKCPRWQQVARDRTYGQHPNERNNPPSNHDLDPLILPDVELFIHHWWLPWNPWKRYGRKGYHHLFSLLAQPCRL